MNYYKDALYTLEHITEVPSIFIHETVKDLAEVFKELVDKEEEMQSRKDKLVVGSVWQCDIGHEILIGGKMILLAGNDSHYNRDGMLVKIACIQDGRVTYTITGLIGYETQIGHFLVCFKPKEAE